MIKFKYYGEAVGEGRPRIARQGSYVHAYTPKKTAEFEEAIRFEFLASTCDSLPVYEKGIPLKAEIVIGIKIPKSYSKKKQAMCASGELAPVGKPDTDNVVKSVLDALNGGTSGVGAYADDSQVVKITAEKVYAEDPFVEVTIDEL